MNFERRELESLIKQDINGRFFANYKGYTLSSVFQPIYNTTKNIMGFEALLRMTTEQGQSLRTDLFFKSAKFSYDFKIFVERLSRAIHIRNFAQSSNRDSHLYLNTIPRANEYFLNNSRNTRLLMERLSELEIGPEQIVIEIVELDAHNENRLKRSIDHLKDLGFNIAVDDYGSDSSDFERVSLINPNIVKMDKSLLDKYTFGHQSALCEALDMSASINAQTVIEGVETEDQFISIADLNAGMYQGYHFAMPFQLDVDAR